MTFEFEWDPEKERANRAKHGVSFEDACRAFEDPRRVFFQDDGHSAEEARYFVFGMVGPRVLSVRFTLRGSVIRIFGAGYWRRGRRYYEEANRLFG